MLSLGCVIKIQKTFQLVQTLSSCTISLHLRVRTLRKVGTLITKSVPRLIQPDDTQPTYVVFKSYDTDILRPRSTNCMTGLVQTLSRYLFVCKSKAVSCAIRLCNPARTLKAFEIGEETPYKEPQKAVYQTAEDGIADTIKPRLMPMQLTSDAQALAM